MRVYLNKTAFIILNGFRVQNLGDGFLRVLEALVPRLKPLGPQLLNDLNIFIQMTSLDKAFIAASYNRTWDPRIADNKGVYSRLLVDMTAVAINNWIL